MAVNLIFLQVEEVPAGAVNGVNAVFTLSRTPIIPATLAIYKNGIKQRPGSGNDFTLSGATVTFEAGAIPSGADLIEAAYI